MQKTKILPVFIPFQGCKNRCTYCNQNEITGIDNTDILKLVEDQIILWKSRMDTFDEVAFYGGTFSRLPSYIRKQMYVLASPSPIRISTCPDAFSESFLNEIKHYNIKTIELGVQSLSDKVLLLNKRTYDSSCVKECCSKLSKKVFISAQFMVGMYGEEREDVMHTALQIHSLKSNLSRIYPTIVLPRTELEELYISKKYQPLEPSETLMRAALYYIALTASGSKVIRTGLPAEIKSANMIAGYWHPAMGDLVKTLVVALYANGTGKVPRGYAGYGAFIRKNFHSLPYGNFEINDYLLNICTTLMELYIENNKWFTEKQNIEIAKRLSSQANIR